MEGLFLKDVFIPGVKKETIEHEIEQILTFISFDRDKLIALAASSPRQMKDVEGNLIDWIDYACFEVKEILSKMQYEMAQRIMGNRQGKKPIVPMEFWMENGKYDTNLYNDL